MNRVRSGEVAARGIETREDPLCEINVRPMQPEEKPKVRAMFNRSFALVKRWFFFSWTPHVLVAERNGVLLGAVMLEIYPLSHGRKGGFVTWIFTAPEARGTGAGQRLIEAALDFFEAQGCDEVTTFVEGYNASSSKLFSTRGFSTLSFGQQLRRYGLGFLGLWVRWRHLVDLGHFVWARPGAAYPDSPAQQWWGTLLANVLVAFLTLWRCNSLDLSALAHIPCMCLLFFGARWLAMALAAKSSGLEVRFRAWETGFTISLAVSIVFGFFFPVPGGAYPISNKWRYRDLLPKFGPMALAGVLPTLFLAGITWGLAHFAGPLPGLGELIGYARLVGSPLILFDVVTIFFPFISFNGRRIWDWSRPLWAVLALMALVVFFV